MQIQRQQLRSGMASILFPCQPRVCCFSFAREIQPKNQKRHREKPLISGGSCHSVIKNQKTCTFTYNTADNVPLHELPGVEASFDQYMEDKGRAVRAIIPEKATAQQLNQEEWRIKMPVIQALFLTVQPVIDIRVRTKSNGEDYPPHIPPHITKLYETHTTKWELQGLHADYMPPLFNLEATGTLYPQRHGTRSCIIKNQLKANITIVFPPLLSWVPEHVLDDILRSIIRKIVEDIKKGYTVRLLADYRSFQRSKFKNSV